ncbi:putative integral membrane protein [Theileria parva strain Muguga]|uniref:putative integral membrane protein n=1 Tax=Theileria parva strain Muguga TaxID=333668 RepID=UPI001C61DB82|nr:putative integral membrane protein [Theileria parva strain Muguga]EAN33809.2 putative integral membrane protein [Theileria parva strain Muguga]
MMLCNVGRSSVYFSGILRKSVPARFSYLNNSRRYFGSYIEDYYTTNHAATGFSSPLRKSFAFLILIAQATLTFGALLHTNYYFTGKALPKTDGQSQLCSDSR